MIIARSDLIATVPHALAVYFARLSSGLAVTLPPFDIGGFDVKQHWHRKYHNDSRNKWVRKQVAQLFNDENDEWQDVELGTSPSPRSTAADRRGRAGEPQKHARTRRSPRTATGSVRSVGSVR